MKLTDRKALTLIEWMVLVAILILIVTIFFWGPISELKEREAAVQETQKAPLKSAEEKVLEPLAEKIKNASPEERPKLMVGASTHDLRMAGIDSHGSSLSGISGPWSDDEGNLYFFKFDVSTVTHVWEPIPLVASIQEKEVKLDETDG